MAGFLKPRRKRSTALASVFTRPLPPLNETRHLWDEFCATGSVPAFQVLMERFAPLVSYNATRLKQRSPDFFVEDLDDLISDGMIGLAKCIRHIEGKRAGAFIKFVGR